MFYTPAAKATTFFMFRMVQIPLQIPPHSSWSCNKSLHILNLHFHIAPKDEDSVIFNFSFVIK